jgi:hypothetical protein
MFLTLDRFCHVKFSFRSYSVFVPHQMWLVLWLTTLGRIHRVSTIQETLLPSPNSGTDRELCPTRARVANSFRRLLMRVLD